MYIYIYIYTYIYVYICIYMYIYIFLIVITNLGLKIIHLRIVNFSRVIHPINLFRKQSLRYAGSIKNRELLQNVFY